MVNARVRQPESLEEASEDRFYAAQEAADFLGIHRSTLHLAVRKMKLTPDAYTPGGHARFRRETLERFSDRLALDSATGGDGSMARALANAVATLSQVTALEPVCEAVVDAALTACPGFEACAVLACGDDRPLDDFLVLASRGMQKRLEMEYRWLHRRPGVEFISSIVARDGVRFLCSDISATDAGAPEGSQRTLGDAGWRRCAALPCVSYGQTLGVLFCLGQSTCDFSEPEVNALENLADVVTVALRRWRRDEAIKRQTEAMGALMRQTLEVNGHTARDDNLATMRRICQQGNRATLVREWGISAETDSEAPAPLADLLREAAEKDAPQRIEWTEGDELSLAIATPAPTPGGRAAVGAIWRRQDLRTGMELALLQVYAQSCATLARQ